MESRLLRATRISRQLIGDPILFAAISSIVNAYREVTATPKHPLFATRAAEALAACQEIMSDLNEGHVVVPPFSPLGHKNYMHDTERDVKATSSVDAEAFWNSAAGQKYFQFNIDLIERGVKITRVFIGNRPTLLRHKPIIDRHRQVGIAIQLGLTEELPVELCEDYLIADDRIVVTYELTRDALPRSERISVEPQVLVRALNNFRSLLDRAHDYEEIFPE
jgi:hypothetical protein